MFKLSINPQQVLYPSNLHIIVLTEPVSWEYPHRLTPMELSRQDNSPQEQYPWNYLYRAIFKLIPQKGYIPHRSCYTPISPKDCPTDKGLILSPACSREFPSGVYFLNISFTTEFLSPTGSTRGFVPSRVHKRVSPVE